MIECIECGYTGTPAPLNEAESMYGFNHVCPKCNSKHLKFITAEPSLIRLAPKTPKVQPLILPATI